jgi:hypothetical protein
MLSTEKSSVGFFVGLKVFHTDNFSFYNRLLCVIRDAAPGTTLRPCGLRVAQPQVARKGEACPA